MDLQQEKLEEMRRDMLEEEKMRTDFEYAIVKLTNEDTKALELFKIQKNLNVLGWQAGFEEILETIEEIYG